MKKRVENIDLLKVLMMYFVVIIHCIVSGLHIQEYILSGNKDMLLSFKYLLLVFLQTLVVIAVNVFFLISGFFGIRFRINRFYSLVLRTVFYSSLIYFVLCVLGLTETSIRSIIHYSVLAINNYWFILVYLLLMISAPYINKIIESFSRDRLFKLSIIFFIIFCIYGYAFRIEELGIVNGYSFIWALYMYFIGTIIRLCYNNIKLYKIHSALVYIICAILNFVLYITLVNLGKYEKAWDLLYSYNNPLILVGAISFFLIFLSKPNLNKPLRTVSRLAPYTLAVFLIHSMPLLRVYRFKLVEKAMNFNAVIMIAVLFVYCILLFGVCVAIDYMRNKMLGGVEHYISSKLEYGTKRVGLLLHSFWVNYNSTDMINLHRWFTTVRNGGRSIYEVAGKWQRDL